MTFWNQLDEIGIDAYFPVANTTNPTVAQLQNNWVTTANTIENWRSSAGLTGKRVIFSETGILVVRRHRRNTLRLGRQPVDRRARAIRRLQRAADRHGQPQIGGTERSGGTGRPRPTPTPPTAFRRKTSWSKMCWPAITAVPCPRSRPAIGTPIPAARSAPPAIGIAAFPIRTSSPHFNRGVGVSYTVSLSNNRTFDQLRVGSNVVTFQSNSTTTSRTMTADDWHTGFANRGMIIGVSGGDVGVVNSNLNGSASVTISTRAATLGEAAGAIRHFESSTAAPSTSSDRDSSRHRNDRRSLRHGHPPRAKWREAGRQRRQW